MVDLYPYLAFGKNGQWKALEIGKHRYGTWVIKQPNIDETCKERAALKRAAAEASKEKRQAKKAKQESEQVRVCRFFSSIFSELSQELLTLPPTPTPGPSSTFSQPPPMPTMSTIVSQPPIPPVSSPSTTVSPEPGPMPPGPLAVVTQHVPLLAPSSTITDDQIDPSLRNLSVADSPTAGTVDMSEKSLSPGRPNGGLSESESPMPQILVEARAQDQPMPGPGPTPNVNAVQPVPAAQLLTGVALETRPLPPPPAPAPTTGPQLRSRANALYVLVLL